MAAHGVFIFVSLGGEQHVPFDVTLMSASIDLSELFQLGHSILYQRRYLVSTETHDGIEKIEHQALMGAGL